MSDFDAMMYEGFDDVEPSYGFSNEPLPSGWYPLECEKVLETRMSRNGAPTARVQLKVTEGDSEGKRAFANVIMGPSVLNPDGTARTDEERAKTAKTIQTQMRGWLQSLGVTTGQPVGEDDVAKAASFFSVGSWEGRQFMGYLKLVPKSEKYDASNRMQGYRSLDDEKKGISAWRAEQAGAASGGGEAQTI